MKLGDAHYLDYAERHREVIREFGRFPHRNALLAAHRPPPSWTICPDPAPVSDFRP
jgi:uncharacterized protein (DUF924 family)